MIYDIDYFINKFSSIPEEKWCADHFVNGKKHCALGHCGQDPFTGRTEESHSLINLFPHKQSVSAINDGGNEDYQQPTPKQRVLAALNDLKNKPTMNINAEPGTKITVTERSINNGYQGDKESANKYLRVGNIYTLNNVDISPFVTYIEVEELPNLIFNSIHFEDIEDEKIY